MSAGHNALLNTHWTNPPNKNLLILSWFSGDKQQNVHSPSRKEDSTKRKTASCCPGAALFRFGSGHPLGNQRENRKTDLRPRRWRPQMGNLRDFAKESIPNHANPRERFDPRPPTSHSCLTRIPCGLELGDLLRALLHEVQTLHLPAILD